jgi:hypothetical protein
MRASKTERKKERKQDRKTARKNQTKKDVLLLPGIDERFIGLLAQRPHTSAIITPATEDVIKPRMYIKDIYFRVKCGCCWYNSI